MTTEGTEEHRGETLCTLRLAGSPQSIPADGIITALRLYFPSARPARLPEPAPRFPVASFFCVALLARACSKLRYPWRPAEAQSREFPSLAVLPAAYW